MSRRHARRLLFAVAAALLGLPAIGARAEACPASEAGSCCGASARACCCRGAAEPPARPDPAPVATPDRCVPASPCLCAPGRPTPPADRVPATPDDGRPDPDDRRAGPVPAVPPAAAPRTFVAAGPAPHRAGIPLWRLNARLLI